MDRFYSEIFEEQNGGAILMGVCRGRISEGLDFSDNAARCVMVVGVPYPMMTDPKVLLKQQYLDARNMLRKPGSNSQTINGKEWYN